MLLSIIVFIILFIIILVGLYLLTRPPSDKDDQIMYDYFTDIRPKLKTGDIMLFSSKKINGNFLDELSYKSRTTFLDTEYGHVGLVVKNPVTGQLYMLECTDHMHTADDKAVHLNNYKRGGIRIIDLDTLLKRYQSENAGIFAVKFIKHEIPYHLIMDNLHEYCNVIFDQKWKLVVLAVTELMVSHNLAVKLSGRPTGILAKSNLNSKYRRMMCSEFVHEILYRCRVAKPYQSKLVWPHVYTLSTFRDMVNVKFSKQYKFSIKNHEHYE